MAKMVGCFHEQVARAEAEAAKLAVNQPRKGKEERNFKTRAEAESLH